MCLGRMAMHCVRTVAMAQCYLGSIEYSSWFSMSLEMPQYETGFSQVRGTTMDTAVCQAQALTTNVMPLLSTPHTCQYSVGFFNVITDVPTDTMTAHSRIRDIPSD
ncbi:predicted protein [Plenodomus lingam JN3]|uniref:Predicted protein n=1 Tax=Leptosphaeria maculans (strain JN3 / isolate v23.1.3 / race Av1-4-5-6-7-8) TaxID=985895 RepID=E5R4Z1_LEPMJ|nr:predicted protein [Plenodomus lingam JN3]CBX92264.1 predicted protein [Plenodomus lingam JN3]